MVSDLGAVQSQFVVTEPDDVDASALNGLADRDV